MASLHSGLPRESVELLRIETDLFDLYLKGKPYHPTVEALHLHRDSNEEWVQAALDVIPASNMKLSGVFIFSPIQGQVMERGDEPVYPLFYENQTYQLVVEKKADIDLSFYHENIHLRRDVKPLGKNILSGNLNFRSEVGYTELEIRLNGLPVLNIRLEIFPAKLDYRRDYYMLLTEVNEQIYNLAFDFLRKTYQLSGIRETSNQSLTEFFAILKVVFQQLASAVEHILVTPHHRLVTHQELRRVEQVKRAGKVNRSYLTKHPEKLIPDPYNGAITIRGERYTPTHLMEARRLVDFDTPENRFLRWMLLRIQGKLKDIHLRVTKRGRNNNEPVDHVLLKQIDDMQRHLNQLSSRGFLSEVGELKHISITLVMQMAPGYRDVYRYYLILMKGLSIQGDLFRMSLKDLAQLYEYWCFLKLHSLLKQKYDLIHQDIIRVHRNGLFVTLDKSKKASVTYRNPVNGEQFTLYYNSLPSEDAADVPTVSQRPDNVLTLKKENSPFEYKYIFDAKYRLNPAYPGTSYHEKYGGPGPEEDDINTMHRYRDAIVYENRLSSYQRPSEYERSMFGAYVLFPYADEEKYREHRFYKSIKKVNIGALPFLPHSTRLVEEFLDELILDSPEKAFERSTRPRGTGKYYEDKLQGKNVMVGSMRDKDQLDICLREHLYWIPLERLAREQKLLTELEWIGLYQSKRRFGPHECGIRWYGKILSWYVVRRYEIKARPPRPGTEKELYVLFKIGDWIKRERAIQPGERSIYTRLFTTKYIFDRAEEIAELKLENDDQIREWREKRRQGKVQVELDDEYVDKAKKILALNLLDSRKGGEE